MFLGNPIDSQNRPATSDAVRLEKTPGGLVGAVIRTPHADALVYLHGAHVAQYQPRGQRPVLFMSTKSHLKPTEPIRGGVPVIFPWFGPCAGDCSAPMHGFARIQPWTMQSASQQADGSVRLILTLHRTDAVEHLCPFAFSLCYSITIGRTLELALEVGNLSARPFAYEEALHTYLAVADARRISIAGLAGASYLDKTDGMKRKQQGAEPFGLSGETDRVYLNTTSPCVVNDLQGGRRITVEKGGSGTTVVWNPWIAKAKALPDFGDDEWRQMLCVETANAADNAIVLGPGQQHVMQARIRCEEFS